MPTHKGNGINDLADINLYVDAGTQKLGIEQRSVEFNRVVAAQPRRHVLPSTPSDVIDKAIGDLRKGRLACDVFIADAV